MRRPASGRAGSAGGTARPRRIVFLRAVDRSRVAGVVPRHRVEQERAVLRGPRERPGRVERRGERDQSVPRAQAVGGLQPADAGERRGLADRAAGVGAGGAGDEPRGDGRGGAARAAARNALRIPGIAHRAEEAALVRRAHRELVHVGLADAARRRRAAGARRRTRRRARRSRRACASRRWSAGPRSSARPCARSGCPPAGPRAPFARAASAARACASAPASSTVTKALSVPLACAMRSSAARVSSTAETSRASSRRSRAAMVSVAIITRRPRWVDDATRDVECRPHRTIAGRALRGLLVVLSHACRGASAPCALARRRACGPGLRPPRSRLPWLRPGDHSITLGTRYRPSSTDGATDW